MAAINTWPGWKCVRRIGAGSFGTVYEIEKKERGKKIKAALKVMSVPQSPEAVQEIYDSGLASTYEDARTYINSQIENASQEFKVMAELRGNPNIVSFEDYMVVPHQGWIGADVLIRMELLTPLNRYMRDHTLQEPEIIRLGIDICNALETCHTKVPPILHRDIKAANIMLDEYGRFKLGDFGVARVMEGTKSAHTKAGTEDHMAPEVMQMQGYRATADLYSLGIVLYRLLNNNRNPFLPVEGSLTENAQLQARGLRLAGQPVPPPQYGSPALQSVVLKALQYLPENRYQSAAEMRAALQQCQQYGQYAAGTQSQGTVNLWQANDYAQNAQGINNTGTVVLQNDTGTAPYSYEGMQGSNAYGPGMGQQTVVENGANGNSNVNKAAPGKKPIIPIIAGVAVLLIAILGFAVISGGSKPSSSSHTSSQTTGSSSSQTQSSQSTGSSGGSQENEFDSIEILTDSLWILKGDTMRLRLEAGSWILDGQSAGISWSSSDTSIARFNDGGVLEALSPGTFTITAEYEGVTTTGEMTVVDVDESYGVTSSAEPSSVSMESGGKTSVALYFSNLPEGADAVAYDSAGMHINFEWDTSTDANILKLSELYSENNDGTVTVLVYDSENPSLVYAAVHIPVHVE